MPNIISDSPLKKFNPSSYEELLKLLKEGTNSGLSRIYSQVAADGTEITFSTNSSNPAFAAEFFNREHQQAKVRATRNRLAMKLASRKANNKTN